MISEEEEQNIEGERHKKMMARLNEQLNQVKKQSNVFNEVRFSKYIEL